MDTGVGDALTGDAAAVRALGTRLRGPRDAALTQALLALSPAQTARLILRLSARDARRLIGMLPEAPSLRVLRALDPSIAEELVDDTTRDRLARLINGLPRDQAVDVLDEMPGSLRRALLPLLEDRAALSRALDHLKDSAGAVMERRFVSAGEDQTVGGVIEAIRAHADRIGKIYAVYVTDAQGRLTGYLKLRDLLLQDRAARVGDIQRDNPVSVRADSDRAEAAREAEARALPVLPVVDSGGRLIGRITAQELREIDRAEADEDRMIMAGVRVGATATDSVLEIVPRRLPWLAAGLIGAGIAALVVGRHEAALTEAAILASLIPIVMSLAGNAGIQASTVTVQAQTSGAFWTGDLPMRIVREAAGALLNGLAVGLLVAGAVLTLGAFAVIDRPGALAATAGVTLVLVTVQAAVVGTLVPVALDRLGFDPAVATGVFITTSNDVVGVLIFFLIATTLYL